MVVGDKAKIEDELRHRQVAYSNVFHKDSVFAMEVLKDLRKFCHADRSSFHPDPRLHAVIEGRREVWLRIQHQLEKTLEEILEIYTEAPKNE